MKLTWYGHACFAMESSEGSLVFDPYQPGYLPELTMPPLQADAISCSHMHSDHCYVEGVTLTGNIPRFSLRIVSSFHDDVHGDRYGSNQIAVACAEGKTIVHLGDLGCLLTEEQIAAIGHVDVLLVPVGGHYTIDADTAFQVTKQLNPSIVVPMHYRRGNAGLALVTEVEPFLSHFPSEQVVYSPESTCKLDQYSPGTVLVFPWPAPGNETQI